MSKERGVIKNESRAKQLNNFKGLLRPRNITPTDIDGLIDYSGKAFIYIEGKVKGKLLSEEKGQKLALENVIMSHWKAQHPSAVLLFEHDIPSSQQIDVAVMPLRMIFTPQKVPMLCCDKYKDSFWWTPANGLNVIQGIEKFESFYSLFGNHKIGSKNYDKSELEIIGLTNGQFSKRETFDFYTLDEATDAYNKATKNTISALITLRTYRGDSATMIKNERL